MTCTKWRIRYPSRTAPNTESARSSCRCCDRSAGSGDAWMLERARCELHHGSRSFCVFGGVEGQAVAYDVLFQRSPFRSGPHVDPVWDVGEAQAGFSILAYGMRFSFTHATQTQESQG